MDDGMISLAVKTAARSAMPMRVGAVVSRRNRVLSVGYNKARTHPQSRTPYRTLHAEVDAVLGFRPFDLAGALITVVRLTKAGELALSRPCAGCLSMLQDLGLASMTFIDINRRVRRERL